MLRPTDHIARKAAEGNWSRADAGSATCRPASRYGSGWPRSRGSSRSSHRRGNGASRKARGFDPPSESSATARSLTSAAARVAPRCDRCRRLTVCQRLVEAESKRERGCRRRIGELDELRSPAYGPPWRAPFAMATASPRGVEHARARSGGLCATALRECASPSNRGDSQRIDGMGLERGRDRGGSAPKPGRRATSRSSTIWGGWRRPANLPELPFILIDNSASGIFNSCPRPVRDEPDSKHSAVRRAGWTGRAAFLSAQLRRRPRTRASSIRAMSGDERMIVADEPPPQLDVHRELA